MAQWLTNEYQLSISKNYKLIETANATASIESYDCLVQSNDKEPNKIFNIESNNTKCSCYEQQSIDLPYRHIFFAKSQKSIDLFNADMVPDS